MLPLTKDICWEFLKPRILPNDERGAYTAKQSPTSSEAKVLAEQEKKKQNGRDIAQAKTVEDVPSTLQLEFPKNGQFGGRGNALVSVEKIFAGLPKTIVAEVGKPTDADYDASSGKLRLQVKVSADMKAYDRWLASAKPVLDKMSVAKSSHLVVAEQVEEGFVVDLNNETRLKKHFAPSDFSKKYPKGWVLAILTDIDSAGLRSRWNAYTLNTGQVSEQAKNFPGPKYFDDGLGLEGGKLVVELSLRDDKGQFITGDEFGLGEYRCNWCGWKENYTINGMEYQTLLERLYLANSSMSSVTLIGIAPLYLSPRE